MILILPKAIFFDLDDTLISFDGVTDGAWKKTCDWFVSTRAPSFSKEVLLESINKAREWFWSDPERHRTGRMDLMKARRMIVRIVLTELNYPEEENGAYEIVEEYNKQHEELIQLFPDTISTLRKLKNRGIRMALITNGTSKLQRAKITRFDLSEFFEFCLIEEEIGFGKPDVRVYEMALDKIGLKANDVWMVGDNLVWDIETPQKVGIFAIWNDYKKKGLSPDSLILPNRIIHSISELLQ